MHNFSNHFIKRTVQELNFPTMKFSLITFLIVTSFISHAQFWGSNTTSNFTNEAIDVESDNSGNQYVAGYISGETSFDVNTVQTSAQGNGDIYISKYNSSGTLIWVKQFGGNFSDRPTDLTVADANSIIITGQYFGQVSFGAFTLNSVNNSKDIFIVKLDNQGNVIWARSEGGAGYENAYGVTCDNLNNVILTGQFSGNSILGGQTFSSVIDPVTFLPNYDIFLSKFDSNGNPLWVRTAQADYEDRGLAVYCDAQNNIFMTGQFSDTLAFGGSTFNNMGYNIGFLCKFSPSGTMNWLNQMRAGMVIPYDLEINDLDEVVIAGDFMGNMLYTTATTTQNISNPFSKKIFIIKTNNDGGYIWNVTLGSDNELSARTISIDGTKNSYITGYFKCNLTQLHESNTAHFNSVGFKDAYLMKIDNTGNIVYTKQFGGKQDDEGHGIAILPGNTPSLCGSYTQNLMIPEDVYNYTYVTNQNGNFNLHYTYDTYSGLGTMPYIFLEGDISRNSFLTNAIYINTPAYNYFVPNTLDSLNGFIEMDEDSLDFCIDTSIEYNSFTYFQYGPDYNYIWNTGDITDTIYINQTGNYSVIVERKDGCSNGTDSIFCIHHLPPPIPLMTDNLGIALNEPGPYYAYYSFCAPDSVQIWFNNLCDSCSITITDSTQTYFFQDTLPHFYNLESLYSVMIQDSFCYNGGEFRINLDYIEPFIPIEPYLSFVEDLDRNDTITMCEFENLHVHVYDFLTNPDTTYNQFNLQPLVDSNFNINPNITWNFTLFNGYQAVYHPIQSGWYSFNYTCTIGYDNLCGLDTLMYDITDSIYIIVNPLPTAFTQIQADNLLCPDGSAYLFLTNIIPGFNWYNSNYNLNGFGIEWESPTGDSVQVSVASNYFYAGTMVDPLTGCGDSLAFSFQLMEKQPPIIIMDPEDGIVCPYDSVTLSVENIYFSYDWIGPEGYNISTTNVAVDDDQGFYYVHVLDDEGCYLTSAPAEIREFTTPSLFVEPSNVLCPGESATISVTYLGDATINWTSPIVSQADEIVVSDFGYYVCEIQQCGMTFLDSVEILDGSFEISLSATDTLLCFNDSSIIVTQNGYNDYQWNNGIYGSNTIFTTVPGIYFVNATNQFGCIAYSDSIEIFRVGASVPPAINDLSICPGADALLTVNALGNLNWYTADSMFIQTSPSLQLNSIYEDTVIIAAYDVPSCPPAYAFVAITVLDSIAPNSIIGDNTLCPNESSIYELQNDVGSVNWYIDGSFISNGVSLQYSAPLVSPASQVISTTVSNTCFSDTFSLQINTVQPATISLSTDSLVICSYSITPITANGIFDTLTWTSSGGTVIADTFYLTTQEETGTIYVEAIDLNGCSTNSDSIFIMSSTLNYALYQDAGFSCFNDSILIGVLTDTDSLMWSTPEGINIDTSQYTFANNVATSGWYYIELWDTIGCSYSDSIYISLNFNPQIDLVDDTMLCLSDWLSFNTFEDSLTYSWEGIGVVDSLPIIENTWYTVIATSQFGCSSIDSVYIIAIDCEDDLPNVITTNSDGINDTFIIDEAPIFPNNHLQILNRWGNIIFEMNGYDNSFNGADVSDGVYFYYFIYDTTQPEALTKQGYLHILK